MVQTSLAPPDTRRRNLARILHLIHLNGPQSRAVLTELTGLNRSTVADLVAELVAQGLVTERAPEAPVRVGRPSPVVAASPHVFVVAANPEVDSLEIAAIGLDHSVRVRERLEYHEVPTPEHVIALIVDRLQVWQAGPLANARIVSIGIAVPGLVRNADGMVRNAPHLRWVDVPLAEQVAVASGIPTVVENDATLGALAEQRFGAARGFDSIVYLNGGASGIGGGLIFRGTPVVGTAGYAGEFGQSRPSIVDGGDRRVLDGVLEDEVNRRRLLNVLHLSTADDQLLARELAASQDPVVVAELARQRRVLAGALANAINVLNPAVIVLGGFLAVIAELGMQDLTSEIQRNAMRESTEGLEICAAGLGADRLLIGAASFAFAELLREPLRRWGVLRDST